MRAHSMRWPRLLTGGVLALALFAGVASAAEKQGAYYGGQHTEYPSWFKESFLKLQDDVAEARANNKRVMILFTQDNCPYCHALVERNLSQKDIETTLRKNFDVIALNMWGDRMVVSLDNQSMPEKQFAASLKVQYTPTMLFLDPSGKTVLRLNGYVPPAQFKTALEYVVQGKDKAISYRDYLAAKQPAASGGDLIAEPFFKTPPYNLTRKGAQAKPIAVFFEQRDCPNCSELHSKVLTDKDTRGIMAPFDTIQLDMWSNTPVVTPQGKVTTAREWAKSLDVKYAPTIVLFNNKGKEIIRSEAFFKVFHTQGIFTYVSSGAYLKEPSFQRYLSAQAEQLREQGQDVDIWRMADEPVGKK